MKQFLGILLALVIGIAPAVSFSGEGHKHNEGAGMVKVMIETNKGNITLELDQENAPKTVDNFVKYAKSGHYDNTIFHRVIPGFMIQGGGFDVKMKQKDTNPPIDIEADNGLKNFKGTVAMARTGDPNSATSQFFINVADNDFLNHTSATLRGWGYTVFGKVTDGMETVSDIEGVKTSNAGGHQNVPVKEVIIEKVTIVD